MSRKEPMLRSMTGFGEASAESAGHRVTATVRSVNHRFLDVVVRIADEYRALEAQVAELARSRMSRGRVEVRVSVESVGDRPVEVSVRAQVLRDLLAELEPLRAEGLIEGKLRPGDVARLPHVVEVSEVGGEWAEGEDEVVRQAVSEALGQASSAREEEGDRLRGVLLDKLDLLSQSVAVLERQREAVVATLADSLRERLTELVADVNIPEERLATEAALLVEKSDIREELDRLVAHIEHFRALCAGKGPHGRRLEFLTQELVRELNTLGGKCRDGEMAQGVVDAKLLCEQLREQILNVE